MSRDRPIEKSACGSRSSGGEPEVARSLIIPIARPSPPNEFVCVFISIYLFGCFFFFSKAAHSNTIRPTYACLPYELVGSSGFLFIFFFCARRVVCFASSSSSYSTLTVRVRNILLYYYVFFFRQTISHRYSHIRARQTIQCLRHKYVEIPLFITPTVTITVVTRWRKNSFIKNRNKKKLFYFLFFIAVFDCNCFHVLFKTLFNTVFFSLILIESKRINCRNIASTFADSLVPCLIISYS